MTIENLTLKLQAAGAGTVKLCFVPPGLHPEDDFVIRNAVDITTLRLIEDGEATMYLTNEEPA